MPKQVNRVEEPQSLCPQGQFNSKGECLSVDHQKESAESDDNGNSQGNTDAELIEAVRPVKATDTDLDKPNAVDCKVYFRVYSAKNFYFKSENC
jgi:hypothetical protein